MGVCEVNAKAEDILEKGPQHVPGNESKVFAFKYKFYILN
jgi:hypothetical protein